MGQGRPIGVWGLAALLPLVSLGGPPLAYLAVCFLLAAEGFLVFVFFRRFFDDVTSLMLAIVYLLFPAYASKYLFVRFHTHLASLCFWAAAVIYTRGYAATSAVLMATTILIYETHLLQGALIPIVVLVLGSSRGLTLQGRQNEIRRATRFLLTFLGIAGLLFWAKVAFFPGRLSTAFADGFSAAAERLFTAGVIGIKTIMFSHGNRAEWLTRPHPMKLYIGFFVILAVTYLIYRSQTVKEHHSKQAHWASSPWSSVALFLVSVTLIYVSYVPFALNYDRWPPVQLTGRLSEVHWGAAGGYVLAWASLVRLVASGRPKTTCGAVILPGFLLYSFVMSGFFISYQERLVQNWAMQTSYWNMIRTCIEQHSPSLVVLDSDEEEQRLAGSEEVFGWTVGYFPFLMDMREKNRWPLVQTLSLLKSKRTDISEGQIQISPKYTWFLFPCVSAELAETMTIKPFDGTLVESSPILELNGQSISPGLTCRFSGEKF